MNNVAEYLGAILGQFILAALFSLIGAVSLRLINRWIPKKDLSFGNAYVTVLLPSLICVIIGATLVLIFFMITQSIEAAAAASLLMVPIGFLIQAGVISSRMKTSFGSACIITLIMIALITAIIILIYGIVFAVMIFF